MCYKRYIDVYLIMACEGDMVNLEGFMQKLNENTKNITLTWNFNRDHMVFLDLQIFKKGNLFQTCN